MIFCLNYFGKSSRNVDLVQAVPFYAFKPVAAADFAGKFYYQFVYGFIHVVAFDAHNHVGPGYFYVSFCGKFIVVVLIRLIREFYSQAYYSVVMHEQLLHFICYAIF